MRSTRPKHLVVRGEWRVSSHSGRRLNLTLALSRLNYLTISLRFRITYYCSTVTLALIPARSGASKYYEASERRSIHSSHTIDHTEKNDILYSTRVQERRISSLSLASHQSPATPQVPSELVFAKEVVIIAGEILTPRPHYKQAPRFQLRDVQLRGVNFCRLVALQQALAPAAKRCLRLLGKVPLDGSLDVCQVD